MRTKVGDTVTILARGRFKKVDVTGASFMASGKPLHIGVFTGTTDVVWFVESDVVRGTRAVADDR